MAASSSKSPKFTSSPSQEKRRQKPHFRSWKKEDREQLEKELDESLPISEISKNLKRSERAITIQLQKILYFKHKNGEDISTYYKHWPITEEEMRAFIALDGKVERADTARIKMLEQRVADLEQKVAELAAAGKKPIKQ